MKTLNELKEVGEKGIKEEFDFTKLTYLEKVELLKELLLDMKESNLCLQNFSKMIKDYNLDEIKKEINLHIGNLKIHRKILSKILSFKSIDKDVEENNLVLLQSLCSVNSSLQKLESKKEDLEK